MENKDCNPGAAEKNIAAQRHAFRSARNILTDLLPGHFGTAYPLPDILVCAESSIVSFGKPGTVIIYFAQPDTDYEFHDAETNDLVNGILSRSGNQITFKTGPLINDNYTFNVFAVKKESKLRKQLLQTVSFKIGVNVTLPVMFKEDVLPGIGYGNTTTIIVQNAQGGCIYQALDSNNNALSEKREKENTNDLEIITNPLFEDTEIQIRVSNTTIKQESTLTQRLDVKVFPDNRINPKLKDKEVDYNETTMITLDRSQQTAQYQLAIAAIDDDSVTSESIQQGMLIGAPVPGTGKELVIPVTKLKEDTTYKIVVTKTKTELSKEVEEHLLVQVRPDPGKALSIVEGVADKDNTATIKVALTQKGIRYQLRSDADNSNVGLPVYHHKNYGIGKARIEIEFAVDPFEDDSVYLPTGPLAQTTTFNVHAIKATTRLDAVLNSTITVTVNNTV